MQLQAELLIPGYPEGAATAGPALKLSQPISFWGGISTADGTLLGITGAPKGRSIAATTLFIQELRGSSSASSVLLELIYRRLAPAAIILDAPDAILALGVIVGREMGWPTPPILRLRAADQARIAHDASVVISASGEIRW
jgi:uncharacterized protein